jgi:hypothetical protein
MHTLSFLNLPLKLQMSSLGCILKGPKVRFCVNFDILLLGGPNDDPQTKENDPEAV